MSKKTIAIGAVGLVLACAVGFLFFTGTEKVQTLRGKTDGNSVRGKTNGNSVRVKPAQTNAKQGGKQGGKKTASQQNKKRKVVFQRSESYDDRTDLSAEDKRLLKAIKAALDAEDLKALLKVLSQAMASPNAEVRGELVDALGWFGKDAMLELLPLMADSDDEVAESAVDNWTFALNEIDNEKEKSASIEAAMKVITNNDALETMVMELDDCDEMIELQTLVNVIEGGNKVASKVAREHYEFFTGEKYSGLDAANAWLQKNHVPDDEDDQ